MANQQARHIEGGYQAQRPELERGYQPRYDGKLDLKKLKPPKNWRSAVQPPPSGSQQGRR